MNSPLLVLKYSPIASSRLGFVQPREVISSIGLRDASQTYRTGLFGFIFIKDFGFSFNLSITSTQYVNTYFEQYLTLLMTACQLATFRILRPGQPQSCLPRENTRSFLPDLDRFNLHFLPSFFQTTFSFLASFSIFSSPCYLTHPHQSYLQHGSFTEHCWS